MGKRNMASSKEKKQAVMEAFDKKVKIQTLVTYVAMFCYAYALISLIYWDVSLLGITSPQVEMWTALGIGTALWVFSYFYWRCPACNRFLWIRPGLRACPYCKAAFKEEKKG